jgi:alkaline phosphatase D
MQAFCQAAAHGEAPCCSEDDKFVNGWCRQPGVESHPLYEAACMPHSRQFGHKNVGMNSETGAATYANASDWRHFEENVPFCSVLGSLQQKWLTRTLQKSSAQLNLVVAPSGVLGNPLTQASGAGGGCSGIEWDCYPPAQVHLLHTLANATGCTIILSGKSSRPPQVVKGSQWCRVYSLPCGSLRD